MAVQLDAWQATRIKLARETLAQTEQDAGTDTYSLACSVGALQWRLGDVLRLVDQMTGGENDQ
jgi:hypothetical protein